VPAWLGVAGVVYTAVAVGLNLAFIGHAIAVLRERDAVPSTGKGGHRAAKAMFGFSLLTIIFDDGVDTYFARTRVLERLNFLEGAMPEGVKPQLGPDATGLGWV